MMAAVLLACGVAGDIRAGDRALGDGDLAAAESAYRRAVEREPANPDALYGLGWTYHLADQQDAAKEAFDLCVSSHPDSANCWRGLGSVAMSAQNPALARQRFEHALEVAPGDLRARHSLALLDLTAGDTDAALKQLDALVAEAPGQAEFQQGRAEALLRLHRDEEALAAAREAVSQAEGGRSRAVTRLTLVRALLATSAGRVDAQDCAHTALPVHAWIDEAERLVGEVEGGGVKVPELAAVRREVRKRRAEADEACPGVRTAG